MKSDLFITTIVLMFSILTNSCDYKPTDKIYGREDLLVMPLVNGYELISANKGSSWVFEFPNHPFGRGSKYTISTGRGMKLDVLENRIFFHCDRANIPNEGSTETWFVIETQENDTRVFYGKSEFESFVDSIGIEKIDFKTDLEWYDIFKKRGSVDWDHL